jgi:hypothetical protein
MVTPLQGIAPTVITAGSSPFLFTPSFQGTLVVFGAEVELSRDSGTTWYKVTLNGGAIPLLVKDEVRITWYGSSSPIVTFFPSGAIQ